MGHSVTGEFRRRLRMGPAADRSKKLTEGQRELLRSDAARVQFSRQLRRKLFGPAMFAETAWDILLALYLCAGETSPPGAAELAQITGSPFSTTLRWLSYLDDAGLVSRSAGAGRSPAAIAELSDKGIRLLDNYFIDLREAGIFDSSEKRAGSDSEE